ncbi:MAG: aminotransferase class IV [Longimicrobiales bacterium]
MSIVYLNGQYIPKDKAFISVDDRGFLFGDGIYEVTAAYRGKLFRWPRHLARIQKGLSVLRIDYDPSKLDDVHTRLLAENDMAKAPVSYIYLEITRGVAPRTHAFPANPVAPTVYMFAGEYKRPPRERWEKGFTAVTVPDQRWARTDVKTVQLLPNVLGKQAAADNGVDEIVYVRDGMAIEGALNNFFTVFGDTVVTHPSSNQILPGISREVVLELCPQLGYKVEHKAITVAEMFQADEAFHTGTLTEVKPCVQVDGKPIGNGKVGKVARALFDAFLAETERA